MDEIKVLYLLRFFGIALKRQGEIVENCMSKFGLGVFNLELLIFELKRLEYER